MSSEQSTPTWTARLWGALTSIRLTIFLLLTLACLSILGTVKYDRIYYTVWFLAPLSFFALNLTACLVRGLPQALARVRQPFTPEAARALPERGRFTLAGGPEVLDRVAEILRQEVGRPARQTTGGQELFFRERGRYRPLGPYVVHLALLFILAGGLIGKYLGVEGRVTLMPKETVGTFTSPEGERPLSFSLTLDRFQVLYYQDGSTPREFRSDLTFTGEDGKTERVICRVNDPVTFGGWTFYQSSYGQIVRLQVTQGETAQAVDAPLGRVVNLPGGKARLKVLEYRENLVMPMGGKAQALGPAVKLAFQPEGEHARAVWVLKNYPEFAASQSAPYRFTLAGEPVGFYSVLQVKRDPGVIWVYAGFLLLLPGFYLAFFRPPQRWAVVLEPRAKGGYAGRLLGASPRNRDVFEAHKESLLARLGKGGSA